MNDLKRLIEQGIVYEDEFVNVYFNVLSEPDFVNYFAEDLEKAKTLLNTMIKESKTHKNILVNIMNKI